MNTKPAPSQLKDTVAASSPTGNPQLQDTVAHGGDPEHFVSTLTDEPRAAPLSIADIPASQKSSSHRLTALPRLEMEGQAPKLILDEKNRYESLKLLGRGGAGEVNLVHDHDIHRPIAMKRLLPGRTSAEATYRFAQEVRTVGQLEHPNIIPIHDVGRDEVGELYFTMKFVNGETLENIIEKLQAGDPAYHERFTFEKRTEIFVGILNAIQYAHSKGIIHRDIKPANIMVGPFGEVVVMDWGIAKALRQNALELPSTEPEPDPSDKKGLLQTRAGALMGTPAYMSPEQAAGQTKDIDERSDVYSLCVLFYELLTLHHYLAGKTNLAMMLTGVIVENPTPAAFLTHPHQSRVPAELGHFLKKGLQKDPSKRFQSVQEMITKLENNRQGNIAIQCTSTFVKRMSYGVIHFVDKYPFVNIGLLLALAVGVLVGGILAFI